MIRIGMLTPSSNTVLEPICSAMLAKVEDVSTHFSRFRVVEIGLGERALGQFESEPMLEAAELLADARVDVICWNGTSSGWLGFERDAELCAAIEDRTGVRARTAVLTLNDLLRRDRCRRIALLTPYTDDVQAQIVANYQAEGFEVVAERHAGMSENFAFAAVSAGQLRQMAGELASAEPDAIIPFCTNLAAAPLAATLENELGIRLYDTVATAMLGALEGAGVDPARIAGWGRMFAGAPV